MKFTLNIDTNNEALTDDDASSELARILRELSKGICEGTPDGTETRKLRDVNGNVVGEWTWDTTSD